MKNFTTITGTTTGILTVLILISGKLSSQTEILGHTYGGSLNGHSYYISDCYTTWVQAHDAATHMGGYLVTISSEAENEFIAGFAPNIYPTDPNGDYAISGGAWTGLVATDNNGTCGFWQWVNGETVVFTNWSIALDEPAFTDCGIPIVIGLCSGGWCAGQYQLFGWFTEGYNSYDRKYIIEFNSDPGCSNSNKTYVCHNGNTICVNNDAVQAHLNHGDYAGPCGPCNSNLVQFTDGNAPIMAGNHITEKETAYNPDRYTKDEDILVYPNPGRDEINIGLPPSFTNGVLRIFTLRGEEIMKYNVTTDGVFQLDISSIPAGMYVVDLRSADGHWQKKFIRAE